MSYRPSFLISECSSLWPTAKIVSSVHNIFTSIQSWRHVHYICMKCFKNRRCMCNCGWYLYQFHLSFLARMTSLHKPNNIFFHFWPPETFCQEHPGCKETSMSIMIVHCSHHVHSVLLFHKGPMLAFFSSSINSAI